MTRRVHLLRNREASSIAGWYALRNEGRGFPVLHAVDSSGRATQSVWGGLSLVFPMLHAVGSSGRATQLVWGALSVAVLSLALAAESRAADVYWINGSGGNFNTLSNWDDIPDQPDRAPGPNDVAHFGLSVPPTPPANIGFHRIYTVSFPTIETTNQALVVEDDVVTFDLLGHVYLLTASPSSITIGTSSYVSASLTIKNGNVGVTSADANLFVGAGIPGSLTVTTGGLLAGSAMDINVGNSGSSGTLTVNSGGDIIADKVFIASSGGAIATATITGNGSDLLATELNVGGYGMGTLNVTAGGDVESTSGIIGGRGTPANTSGTANIDGIGSTWDSGPLIVSHVRPGTLNITNGGRVESASGIIAVEDAGIGTATVSGLNSQWIISGALTVGEQGQGSLNIGADCKVQNTHGSVGLIGDSVGEVSVGGANAQWINSGELKVGEHGEGKLYIGAGGVVQNTNGFVGTNPTGGGEVTVDGVNAQWISGDLSIGYFGPGTLEITGGGLVQSSSGSVGTVGNSTSGGEVNVFDDSQWIISGDLKVGESAKGTLNINLGGKVQNINAFIGFGNNTGGAKTVNVDGANAQWINSGMLFVGRLYADGILNIGNGGWVQSRDGFLATDVASSGVVTVAGAGSIWTVDGRLSIGGDSSTDSDGGTGTLRIKPGGTVSATQDTKLFDDGLLSLEGGTLSTSEISFQGGGTFDWTSGTLHVGVYRRPLTVPNGGVLAPGNPAGGTTIVGDYSQQAGGTLEIEIHASNQWDSIGVSANALLGGNLQLALLNGFVPSPANTFIIFGTFGISNVISGTFANVANGQRLATSGAVGSFVVNYGSGSAFNPKQIVLSNFAMSLPGDVNFDGVVDIFDVNLVSQHWGDTGPTADANGDGIIDIFDINLISSNWTSGAAPVPEPASFALLAFAAPLFWRAQRGNSGRRRRS